MPVHRATAAAEAWARTRTFHHSRYTAQRIAAERRQSVSVCVPARECAATVGEIVDVLAGLRAAGALDEVVVVDAASADGTAGLAERAGARVLQEAALMPEYGPVLGKGDAMWRALPSLEGELVCFVDADTEGFGAHFVTGLLGPLVCEPEASEVSFVKAFYRRPLAETGMPAGGRCLPASAAGGERSEGEERGGPPDDDGGGRVNHLTARPALALLYPQLAEVRQPLAGEVAARRELLERLPFVTGYGVEVGMLIDAWRQVGLEGIVQVDLDEHRHTHQPLSALAQMARAVMATIADRLERDELLQGWPDRFETEDDPELDPVAGWERIAEIDPTPVARPPLQSVRAR
jgi:glucosyl-3-phosphoglycerate synthase